MNLEPWTQQKSSEVTIIKRQSYLPPSLMPQSPDPPSVPLTNRSNSMFSFLPWQHVRQSAVAYYVRKTADILSEANCPKREACFLTFQVTGITPSLTSPLNPYFLTSFIKAVGLKQPKIAVSHWSWFRVEQRKIDNNGSWTFNLQITVLYKLSLMLEVSLCQH